jgi:hypothetical protein
MPYFWISLTGASVCNAISHLIAGLREIFLSLHFDKVRAER